jgi:RNA 2',3'-cyclic 3'-phosphodiesterase
MRLFFALWPDALTASRLHALARRYQDSLGGRVMRVDTLHLTLVFLGEIAPERLPFAKAAAERVFPAQSEPPCPDRIDLRFDRAACWRRQGLVCLGMQQVPELLRRLQHELAVQLSAAGFRMELREYRPHITLLRKVVDASPEIENPAVPVDWTARDFVLVSSSLNVNGSRYEQIGRWPLRCA